MRRFTIVCDVCGARAVARGVNSPTEARALLQRRPTTAARLQHGYTRARPDAWARVLPPGLWRDGTWARGALIDVCPDCFPALDAERLRVQAPWRARTRQTTS